VCLWFLGTGWPPAGQRRSAQCSASENQIVRDPDTCFHEAGAVSPGANSGPESSALIRRAPRSSRRAIAPRAATMQKRGASFSGPSSRSDSRDSERAGNCPRNRSVPRYDGVGWSASWSLACRAEQGRRRKQSDPRRSAKGGLCASSCSRGGARASDRFRCRRGSTITAGGSFGVGWPGFESG
jgi:hypothetical protein